jgi:hypothetical protein
MSAGVVARSESVSGDVGLRTETVSGRGTRLTAAQRESSRPGPAGRLEVSWDAPNTTASSTDRGGSNPGPRRTTGTGRPTRDDWSCSLSRGADYHLCGPYRSAKA